MHQHGFHVERRFGWDTHGLPVEYEIDKTLGIKGPQDVAKMGIAAYNAVCLVTSFTHQRYFSLHIVHVSIKKFIFQNI